MKSYIKSTANTDIVTNLLGVLFEDYVVEILTIISENPGIRRYTMYEQLGTTSLKPRRLVDELIERGLIDQMHGETRTIKLLSLTEEGERVLALIRAIKDGKSIEPTNYGASATVRDSVKG